MSLCSHYVRHSSECYATFARSAESPAEHSLHRLNFFNQTNINKKKKNHGVEGMFCESASLYLKRAFKDISESRALRRGNAPVLNAVRTAQSLHLSSRSPFLPSGHLDKDNVRAPEPGGLVANPLLAALLALEFASEVRDQAISKIVLDSYQVWSSCSDRCSTCTPCCAYSLACVGTDLHVLAL